MLCNFLVRIFLGRFRLDRCKNYRSFRSWNVNENECKSVIRYLILAFIIIGKIETQIVTKLNKDYILDKNKGLNNNERQLIVIVIYFE